MLNYLFKYEWLPAKSADWREGEASITTTTPISAVNLFHRKMQLDKQMAGDRKTLIRPALKPDQYRVLRFFQIYHDSTKQLVYNQLDYPQSPNPDVLYNLGKRLEGGDSKSAEHPEFDLGSAKGFVKEGSK